jgi:sugar phosphate isomerase/epimerase
MYTRRDFGKAAIASITVGALGTRAMFGSPKSDSTLKGVKLGAITGAYGPFHAEPGKDVIDVVVQKSVEGGIGYVELVNTGLVEPALGGSCAQPWTHPVVPGQPRPEGGLYRPPCGNGGQVPGANMAADYKQERDKLRQWRLNAPQSHFTEIKKKFDAAGIDLFSYVMTIGDDFTDPEIDAVFKQMSWLGVDRFCTNQTRVGMGPKMVPYCAKYKIKAAWHNHQLVNDPNEVASPASFDRLLAMSPNFYLNLDIGWYYRGGNDPWTAFQKYQKRISHLHVLDCKDRNTWADIGTGQCHVADMLKYVRDHKLDIAFIIEQNGRTGAANNLQAIEQDLAWEKSVLNS